MKNLIIFASLLSITLGFPVGSPLHKRERRRHRLGFGYGYGQVYPFYVLQPDLNNDFTPEIYICDHTRPSVPRPVTPRPPITSPQRRKTSVVQPVTFSGDLCPPPRDDDINNDQLPVFVYVDPKEWSLTGKDRPFSPDQSGFNDLQPVFAIVPGVFLPASEDSQVKQGPIQNNHGLNAPDQLRATESDRKQTDC